MLGNGYKPVGTVFTILYGDPITGSFSNVDGLVFDDGRERYVLDYNKDIYTGSVTATVESNTTPEPRSVFLALLGSTGMLFMRRAKRR